LIAYFFTKNPGGLKSMKKHEIYNMRVQNIQVRHFGETAEAPQKL